MRRAAGRKWGRYAVLGATAFFSMAFSGAFASVPPASAAALPGPLPARAHSPDQPVGGIQLSPSEDTVPPMFGPATPLPLAEQWVVKALNVRSTRLADLTGEVAGAKTLQSATRTALSTLVSTDVAGITELQSVAPDDGSLAAFNQTAASMIIDYRVFAVVAPVVRVAVAASMQSAEVSNLLTLEPAIEAAITTDQQAGEPVLAAQAAYRDLSTQLAAVASTDESETAAVLVLRPSSYPASNAVLVTARSDLTIAASRLVTANGDLRRIVKLLADPGLSAQSQIRALAGA